MESLGLKLDLLYLFVSFSISALLYPLWINIVYNLQLGEVIRSDGPESHKKKGGTPTMGGLVFVLSVALVTFLFNRSRTQTLFPVFIATVAGTLGLLEDFAKVYKWSSIPSLLRKPSWLKLPHVPFISYFWNLFKEWSRVVGSSGSSGLATYQKFLIQGALAGFVAGWTYLKLGWDYIWLPLMGNIHIGVFYPLFIFVLFIAVLNAVAFTDGLDGLAGGMSLITFLAFWVISRSLQYNSLAGFCATFVGALIPFLYFNVYPARIFMGNVGSHVLGAILPVLAIVLHREIILVVLLAMFLIDGISSPLQQLSVKFTGKRLFRMAPIHHHFEMLGWPETKVTLRFWIWHSIATIIGIFLALM